MMIKVIIRTSEPSRPPSKSAEELGKKPPLTIRKVINLINLKITFKYTGIILITHFQLEKQVDKYDPNYYNPDNDQYLGNLLAVLSNQNIWIMLVKHLATSDHVMVMMKLITMTMITMIITMMANITLRRDVEVDVEMI